MAYLDDIRQVLNIQPVGLPTVVHLSQNENGRRLYFVISGNESAFPSGVTVTISGTKPDGVVYSKSGSITNGVVLINEDTQLTAVAGTWDAKVKIVSSGQTVATGRVRFIIDADPVAPGSVPSDSQLEGLVAEAQWYAENAREEAYGSPLTASTAAGMTDHDHVYVYTGSETGYTAGHWYYWDGSAWEDGGVYNAVAVQTDKTLSVADKAADGKAVGDAIEDAVNDLKSDLNESLSGNYIPIDSFTRHVNPTTYTITPNSVYMATTKNTAYTNTSSPVGYLKSALVAGRKYRLHARLDSFSGNAFKTVAIRGNESSIDSIVQRLDFTQAGEEKTVEFIATGYEDYVSLFLTGSTAAPNSTIQYSNVWLKEVRQKSEINEENLFNGGFCPTFTVKIADGVFDGGASSDIKATDYIEVDASVKYLMKNNYYSSQGLYGLAFYDSTKAYISGMAISPSGTSRKLTCAFVTPSTAKFIRFTFWANTKENLTELIYLSKYSEKYERIYGEKCAVFGEPLKLDSKLAVSILSSFSTSEYGVPQGGDISGNMLFGFSNNLLKNFAINMSTFEIKNVQYNGATVDNHANCVSFGNAKYDSNDLYPAIYISSERARYIGVFRIISTNGQYSITELSRISFPEAVNNNYCNCLVDATESKIYLMGIMESAYSEPRLYEYSLPSSLSENITLDSVPYDNDHQYGYISSKPYVYRTLGEGIPYVYTQDGFIHNNKLYRMYGGENSAALNVTDLTEGRGLSFANLSTLIPTEPEITAKNGDKIIVVTSSGIIYSILDY